jgi:hypothetical protein
VRSREKRGLAPDQVFGAEEWNEVAPKLGNRGGELEAPAVQVTGSRAGALVRRLVSLCLRLPARASENPQRHLNAPLDPPERSLELAAPRADELAQFGLTRNPLSESRGQKGGKPFAKAPDGGVLELERVAIDSGRRIELADDRLEPVEIAQAQLFVLDAAHRKDNVRVTRDERIDVETHD